MFVGSCLITLKENPRVYPWIKIFSYGLPTQNHGEGEGRSMSEICYVPCVSFTSRRVRIIKTVARRGLGHFRHFWNVKNNIQLFPEGEVNSGASLHVWERWFRRHLCNGMKVAPCQFWNWRVIYWIGFHIIPNSFLCRQEKLSSIVWT